MLDLILEIVVVVGFMAAVVGLIGFWWGFPEKIKSKLRPFRALITIFNPFRHLQNSAVRGKLRQRTVSLYRSMSYGLFCPGTI